MAISATAIDEIAAGLRGMGEGALADRLEYLASDEDLDSGECPATAESARGFFALFASVASEGEVVLGCSPEGWVLAEWRFPDERGVGLWFLDSNRVMFTATGKDGEVIDIEGPARILERPAIIEGLIRKELFSWRHNL